MLISSVVAVTQSRADKELEYLPLAAKAPGATIFEKGGIDGPNAYAKAIVTKEEVNSWCANWAPSQKRSDCIALVLKDFGSRQYAAHADCLKKTITAVDGHRYEMAGVWQGGIGHGRTKWKRASTGEVVDRSNADGGLGIALQWEILCPNGGRRTVASSKMVLGPDDYSGSQTLWEHNGSMVYVDHLNGTISYAEPKRSLIGIVAEHAILFRGTITHQGKVDGTAYAFKKNCAPASYHVTGRFDANADSFILKGEAPVWDGCTAVSYSATSPNTKLTFKNAMSR
jgi:hypothetical protein